MSAHNTNHEQIPPTRQKGHAVCHVIFAQHGPWKLVQPFISSTCNSASNFLPIIPTQTICLLYCVKPDNWHIPPVGITHTFIPSCVEPSTTIEVLVPKTVPSALSLVRWAKCSTPSTQVSDMICPLMCYDKRGREWSESCWCWILPKMG